jgi:glutamate 5-kinase
MVHDIDGEARAVAGGTVSGVGTGGMASKVEAARIAGRFGVRTVVLSGRGPQPISTVLSGADQGTLFVPQAERLHSRKHWIAYALKPQGQLMVDPGAQTALVRGGKSLLPSGVLAVRGDFATGDPVTISAGQTDFARGLVNYSAEEIRAIAGKQTSDIEAILGYKEMDEVVHRDDLVIL